MERILKLREVDFVRFCMVGAGGFVINFSLLTLLYRILGLPIIIAQLISSEISLFFNFLLHHNWTYKSKKVSKSIKNLVIQFHATSWVAIIGSALLVSFFVSVIKINYIIALAISSGAALVWNFVWSKYVIWKNEVEETDQ